MRLTRDCSSCGFAHTLERSIDEPQTISLRCHGCEALLQISVPQQDFDDLEVLSVWANAEVSAIAEGMAMGPCEVDTGRGPLRLERHGDRVRAQLLREDGVTLTVTQQLLTTEPRQRRSAPRQAPPQPRRRA